MPTTTPNFGWSVPVSTDLVKDGATAIELLGDSIDTSLVDLKGGTTGQVLAKASGTDMDFSWVAQDDSDAIQNAIVDAKGDLIAATAADTPARLAVGANGTVLTADSAEATGIKWAAVAAGGMTLLNAGGTALSGATTTVSSIAGTYTDLIIYVKDFYPSADGLTKLVLNSDTTSANYIYNGFRTRTGSLALDNGADNRLSLFAVDGTSAANFVSITIPLYSGSNQKQYIANMNFKSDNGTEAACNVITKWTNTAAITEVGINTDTGTFSGGTMYVYGVK
jgi:hypothetical protein